jgi:hypothetical protein
VPVAFGALGAQKVEIFVCAHSISSVRLWPWRELRRESSGTRTLPTAAWTAEPPSTTDREDHSNALSRTCLSVH